MHSTDAPTLLLIYLRIGALSGKGSSFYCIKHPKHFLHLILTHNHMHHLDEWVQ